MSDKKATLHDHLKSGENVLGPIYCYDLSITAHHDGAYGPRTITIEKFFDYNVLVKIASGEIAAEDILRQAQTISSNIIPTDIYL